MSDLLVKKLKLKGVQSLSTVWAPDPFRSEVEEHLQSLYLGYLGGGGGYSYSSF